MVYAIGPAADKRYLLAVPVLGFVEFSLMRTDGKFDAELLSRLYHQYCQVEGDFLRQQGSAHPALARVFAQEALLGEEVTSEVLSWDRVSAGIDAASRVTVGQCYCRTKMHHLGQACDAPREVCLTFNDVAAYLAEYGIAREISRDEAHAIVRDCAERGLVQIGDNKKNRLAVICNCCGCCCDILLAYRRFGDTGLVSPSAFVAAVDAEACSGCGTCARAARPAPSRPPAARPRSTAASASAAASAPASARAAPAGCGCAPSAPSSPRTLSRRWSWPRSTRGRSATSSSTTSAAARTRCCAGQSTGRSGCRGSSDCCCAPRSSGASSARPARATATPESSAGSAGPQIRAYARIQQCSRHFNHCEYAGFAHEALGGKSRETLEASIAV